MLDRVLVAIPVYNEERYVDCVIDEAKRFCRHLLVVDDGSTDETSQRLAQHGEIDVITHPENRGYGQSLADAFAFAAGKCFSWLITMDCDEQHEPSYIPRFVEAATEDDADIISGTRYPKGHAGDSSAPPDRREINRHITSLLNDRLGLTLTDAFCGFKAYRVSCLEHFAIHVPGYAMPMQFWVQAVRARLRIREIPVRLIYKDSARHFGGLLDDPEVRLAHYLHVLNTELSSGSIPSSPRDTDCLPRDTDCLPCR